MLPIVKAIIIIVVVAGVAAPTGYVAYKYLSPPPAPSMNEFIPGNSSLVLDYHVNGTNAIVYASNSTEGILLNYSLTSLKSDITSGTTSGNSSFNGSSINITLYETYDSFQVYRITGFNSSLEANSTFINETVISGIEANASIYVSPIGNSFLVISDLNGVQTSINAYQSGNYLKTQQSLLSIKGNGIGFYMNLSGVHLNNSMLQGSNINASNLNMFNQATIYGNVTANFTNVTVRGVSASLYQNISLINKILPPSAIISVSYSSGVYSAEYNIGYANYRTVLNAILEEEHGI